MSVWVIVDVVNNYDQPENNLVVASELLGLRTVGNRYPPRHKIDNYTITLKQVAFYEVLRTEGT